MQVSTTVSDGLPRHERVLAMGALMVAILMATLDTAVTNTALPTIAGDLGSTGAAAIWVVNAYQLAMVATLVPLAALGEILGHRRVYIAGLFLFTATSLACGLAWSLPSLVLARGLQGLGASVIISVNAALLRFVYPASILGRGVGLNALVVALGFTIGPTVASAILSVTTWHWLFLINVPAGIIAIYLALRALPLTERATHAFDSIAAVLCAGFFTLLILGLGGVSHGSSKAVIATEWLTSVACLCALIWRQAGHPAPMLAIDLLRLPVFALSTVTSICSFITQGLAFVALPFLFQTVMGRSQVATGFLITPWPAAVAIMAPIAGRLSDRYQAGVLGGFGLLILCVGMAALAALPANPSDTIIALCMTLCGIGFGFFQSPNLRALLASAPPGRSGGASGILATARLLGQTAGAALVALCMNISSEIGPVTALWLGSIFAALGSLASFLRLAARKR
jgi:DHA2 family multidrug resistance protein-like MFS transporter